MLSHVLVPLDGSPAAESAIGYAELIPARTMTLLTVVAPPDDAGYEWMTDIAGEEHHRQLREHARAYLETVAGRSRSGGCQVRTLVVDGDPAEQIIAAATDATLILMTSHGDGNNALSAYGRTVDRVARYAAKPVMVVRGSASGQTRQTLTRIIVPLDGSDIADEAAPLAAEMGMQLGLPLHLVSVVDTELSPASATTRAARQIGAYLASEAERLRSHAIQITTEVRLGSPAAELVSITGPSDLIVMTAFGAGTGQRWLLGGVADKLIRFADAPVLIVRPATAEGVAAA